MVDDVARDMQRVLDLIPHQRDQIKDLTDQVEKLTRDSAKAKQDNERVVADWERKLLDAKSAADHQVRFVVAFETRQSDGGVRKSRSHGGRSARAGRRDRPTGARAASVGRRVDCAGFPARA